MNTKKNISAVKDTLSSIRKCSDIHFNNDNKREKIITTKKLLNGSDNSHFPRSLIHIHS